MEFHYRLFSESSWAQCNDVKHRYSFDNRWVTHRGEACWESHCLLLNPLEYSLYMNICTAENRLPLYCELQLLLFVRRPCAPQVITELHFPGRHTYTALKKSSGFKTTFAVSAAGYHWQLFLTCFLLLCKLCLQLCTYSEYLWGKKCYIFQKKKCTSWI